MERKSDNHTNAGIAAADLEVVSKAVMLRFDSREAEEARVNRMRELLWAASELTRALSVHTQHALVDCCGSHGISDLAMDTRSLHRALGRYETLVSAVAAEYRDTVSGGEIQSTATADRRGRGIAEAV